MVPAVIMELEAIPLTHNGKIDRRALPDPDANLLQREYEAPVGETEEVLAEIWQEMLGIEQVGRQDNFFELGGHSLLMVRLVNMLELQFNVNIALDILYEEAHFSEMAELIDIYIYKGLADTSTDVDKIKREVI